MDSLLVPPLTVEARDYFWLPEEADGAVGPRGSYVGSHLEVFMHAVQIHRITSHQPPHGGRGGPTEGTAALQSLLQGARKVEQPGRCCGKGGPGVGEHPDSVSASSRTQPSYLTIDEVQCVNFRRSETLIFIHERSVFETTVRGQG